MIRLPLDEFFQTQTTRHESWRRAQLCALCKMLDTERHALEKALFEDLGKTAQEAWVTEIGFLLHEAQFALKHLHAWMRPQKRRTPFFLFPGKSRIFPMPRGCVLIISPWNYPLQLTLSPLIASFAAGNTAVIKPSEYAPSTSRWLSERLTEYVDARAVRVVEGDAEDTRRLLRERWDLIFFTGSGETARHIARAAAEYLTPAVLELGGKSPCIVAHSRHIRTVARRIAFAKFVNGGQTCVAPDYLLVQASLKEELVHALIEETRRMFGFGGSTMARIVNDRHFKRLKNLFGHGEKILYGGACDAENCRIEPTLIETTWDHPVMEEEIFGPILPIFSLSDETPIADAVSRIAEHPTPLALYLMSDSKADREPLMHVASGSFACNDALMQICNVDVPFGGVGTSGYGQSHGFSGFSSFSHWRSEFEQSPCVDFRLRYPPYTSKKMSWIERLLGIIR